MVATIVQRKKSREKNGKKIDHPKVLKEFKDLLPPLSQDEKAMLTEQCLRDGILDPIIIWKNRNIVIDGHNRLSIAKKFNLSYKVRQIDLPDVQRQL